MIATEVNQELKTIQLAACGRSLPSAEEDEALHWKAQTQAQKLSPLIATQGDRLDQFPLMCKLHSGLRESLWYLLKMFPLHSSFPIATAPMARATNRCEKTIRKRVAQLVESGVLDRCQLSTKRNVLIFTDAGPRLTEQAMYEFSEEFISIIDELTKQDLFLDATALATLRPVTPSPSEFKRKPSPDVSRGPSPYLTPESPKKSSSYIKKELRTKLNQQNLFSKSDPAVAKWRAGEGTELSFDTGASYKTDVENGIKNFTPSAGKTIHLGSDLLPLVTDFEIDPKLVVSLMGTIKAGGGDLTLQTLMTVFVTTKAAQDPRTRGVQAATYLRKMIENDASENRLAGKAARIKADRQEKAAAAAKEDRASAFAVGQAFNRKDGARWWIDRPGFMHSNLSNAEYPMDLKFFAAIDEHTLFAYGQKTDDDVQGTFLLPDVCEDDKQTVPTVNLVPTQATPGDVPRDAVPALLAALKMQLSINRCRVGIPAAAIPIAAPVDAALVAAAILGGGAHGAVPRSAVPDFLASFKKQLSSKRDRAANHRVEEIQAV